MAKKSSTAPAPAKCDTCGKESDNLKLLHKSHLCSNCLDGEYERMGKESVAKVKTKDDQAKYAEKNLNIAKTSRAAAANREITINEYTNGLISITTARHVTCPCEHGLDQVSITTNYTVETLCLLAETLNKTIGEFNIDRDAILNKLKGEGEIHQTFHDFKRIVTRQEEQ